MATEIKMNRVRLVSVRLIMLFFFLAAGILTTGHFFYRGYEKSYRIEAERELTAIAELKVDELMQWRSEHLWNARVIFDNAPFSDLVQRYLRNPKDSEAEQKLRKWLGHYAKYYDYDQVRLLDSQGATRMSFPAGRPPASAVIRDRAAEVMRSGQIAIVDFYRHDHDHRIYLSILIPILDSSAGKRATGVIALRVDPEKYLYAFIQRWPTLRETAETVLVRREGNDVLYLTDLRFQKDMALNFRSPLERTDIPPSMAVLGQTGIVEGVDHRNRPEIAYIRAVPDSPWFLVAHMDTWEAYAPARRLLWMISGFVIVLICSAATGLAFVWRQQQINFYRERYKAAEALRESEERFRSLFERVRVIALVIDPADGSIIDANTAASVFYGWSRDELRAKKISEINTLSPEDLRREIEAAKNEERFYFVFQHCRADGSVRDVEVYSGPLQTGGRTVLYSIIHDITERRQAEERLHQLANEQQIILDTIAIGVTYVKARKLIWTNPAYLRIFGYSLREGEMLDARKLYAHVEDYERVGREGYAIIASGGIYSTEVMSMKKDGSTFWLNLTGRAVNIDYPAEGSIWLLQDITERKRAEQALREKTSQLEDLTRDLEKRVEEEIAIRMRNEQILIQQSKLAAMGEMLGAIAHQWRQPLNTLGMCVQNINDAYMHGDLDRVYLDRTVKKSMDQVRYLSKTIDDFRTFFQPDKEISVFDTMAAVGNVISLFSAQLTSSGIAYRLTCHTHAKTFGQVSEIVVCPEKTIAGYRNEFEHVILNLISNARDAITARREAVLDKSSLKGLITFDFFNREDNVIIEIGDNGAGIPASIMSRVFEPYFTMKEESKGSGIGLYMSKIIIEDHMKGSLTAKNGPQGAVFTIVLRQADKEAVL